MNTNIEDKLKSLIKEYKECAVMCASMVNPMGYENSFHEAQENVYNQVIDDLERVLSENKPHEKQKDTN